MPEQLIPISRKQHDAINSLIAGIKTAQMQLQVTATTILQGIDEDLGEVNVPGVRCVDGVYSLVVEVPEPVARAETT